MFEIELYPLLLLLVLNPHLAIKCIRRSPYVEIMESCEGEYCFKIQYDDESGPPYLAQDCVAGLVLEEGCIIDSVSRTLCICRSENCNAANITNAATPTGKVKCFDYQISLEDYTKYAISDDDKFTKDGSVCFAESWAQGFNNSLIRYGTKEDNTRAVQYAFPIYSHTPYNPQFNIYYHGEIYMLQYGGQVDYYQYCVENYCNRMDFSSFGPGNITCVQQNSKYGLYNSTCTGQYCVYSQSWTNEKNSAGTWSKVADSWQYCLSTNSTFAKHAIGVGIYSAYGVEHHICNTEMCNQDLETAKASIEKHSTQNQTQISLTRGFTHEDKGVSAIGGIVLTFTFTTSVCGIL